MWHPQTFLRWERVNIIAAISRSELLPFKGLSLLGSVREGEIVGKGGVRFLERQLDSFVVGNGQS